MEVALCPQYFSKWNIRSCKQHKLEGGELENFELAILLPNRQRLTSVERLIHSDRYEDPTPKLLQASSTQINHSCRYSKMEETKDQNTLPSSWMYKSPLFALKKKPEVNLMKKMYNMSKEKYSP